MITWTSSQGPVNRAGRALPRRLLDQAEALLNAGATVIGGLVVLAFESADHPIEPWLNRALEIAVAHRGTVTARRAQDTATPKDASANWRSAFLHMP